MEFLDNLQFSDKKPTHYHGDIVRIIFLAAGILMLLGLPFFQEEIPLPFSISMAAVVILIFLAGLTNPRQIWMAFLDTTVSLLGIFIFEYFTVSRFESVIEPFFLVNQLLALLFLASFYFSTKTLRGFYLRN